MSKPALIRRAPATPPIEKAKIMAAVQFSQGGAVLAGEPEHGYIAVRPTADLPGTLGEVHRSLQIHYPKCKFAWKPRRVSAPSAAPRDTPPKPSEKK